MLPHRLPALTAALVLALSHTQASSAAAQTASVGTDPNAAERAALITRLAALRDDFVAETRSQTDSCAIAPPAIKIMVIPSYGNYDSKSNVIQTESWWLLSPREKGFMFRLAGPGADEAAAQRVYERGAHQWVFIHELGHWWQACTSANKRHTRYDREYDANRIAAAYWREHDPAVGQFLMTVFRNVASSPSPVPAGQSAIAYFNANYDKLLPTPAYSWYQATMNVAVSAESPAPSLAQALHDSALR
ncbi:MAG TPA: hypothetical protein VGR64_05140 [Terracidiphilus sp.]|nr:hypothetical protein [Terracidiphilus sp.]